MQFRDELVLSFGVEGENRLQKALLSINRQLNMLMGRFNKGLIGFDAFVKNFDKLSKKKKVIENFLNPVKEMSNTVSGSFKKLQGQLLGAGLSIMFFGMQVKRTFENIARSSTDAFLKVAVSGSPAANTLRSIGSAFEFIKIVIGEAIGSVLTPFLPLLVQIAEDFANWVSQNKELTTGLILLGIILGGIMFFIGQIGLFLQGVVGLFLALGGEKIVAGASSLAGALGKIVPILFVIVGIGKTFSDVFKAIDKAFGKTEAKTNSLINPLKWLDLVLKGIIVTLKILLLAFELVFGGAVFVVASAIVLMIGFFMRLLKIGSIAFNALKEVINLFVLNAQKSFYLLLAGVEGIVKNVVKAVNYLINAINQVLAFLRKPLIPTLDVSRFNFGANQLIRTVDGKIRNSFDRLVGLTQEGNEAFANLFNFKAEFDAIGKLGGALAEVFMGNVKEIATDIRNMGQSFWDNSTSGAPFTPENTVGTSPVEQNNYTADINIFVNGSNVDFSSSSEYSDYADLFEKIALESRRRS